MSRERTYPDRNWLRCAYCNHAAIPFHAKGVCNMMYSDCSGVMICDCVEFKFQSWSDMWLWVSTGYATAVKRFIGRIVERVIYCPFR